MSPTPNATPNVSCVIYRLSNAEEQVGLPRKNKWALGKLAKT